MEICDKEFYIKQTTSFIVSKSTKMSGGPPHHPHSRQAPIANTAWNHLQVRFNHYHIKVSTFSYLQYFKIQKIEILINDSDYLQG